MKGGKKKPYSQVWKYKDEIKNYYENRTQDIQHSIEIKSKKM